MFSKPMFHPWRSKVGELVKTGAACEVVMEKENGTDVGRAGAVSEYTRRRVSRLSSHSKSCKITP